MWMHGICMANFVTLLHKVTEARKCVSLHYSYYMTSTLTYDTDIHICRLQKMNVLYTIYNTNLTHI